ncbi:hypothetical protein K493DRAFT_316067 [Basidiobolus meristosporus CBS 931.73]|uniref:Uncharacterized protein n=1 Tax=Basidiobolus meristosporus CBS 931.73 TaxID=1314790 RepID=A0A1Y1Y609_9FUNG|nr:hypothetical protein K493DRAFT_316067 [Basidiobolus meristosporus CBS 931.73]|eukprot:ORX93325.1 hypothetical protein K493DRAFT_316067 [Basidiobolus meristosporus CBS 931.73]
MLAGNTQDLRDVPQKSEATSVYSQSTSTKSAEPTNITILMEGDSVTTKSLQHSYWKAEKRINRANPTEENRKVARKVKPEPIKMQSPKIISREPPSSINISSAEDHYYSKMETIKPAWRTTICLSSALALL